MGRLFRFAFYVLPPLVALLLALPAALTIAPWNWRYVDLTYSHFLILGPFYVALLAVPGYVCAWLTGSRASNVSSGIRLWVRLSLGASLLCSLFGVAAGYWMIWFSPPALLAAIACGRLIYLFESKKA